MSIINLKVELGSLGKEELTTISSKHANYSTFEHGEPLVQECIAINQYFSRSQEKHMISKGII